MQHHRLNSSAFILFALAAVLSLCNPVLRAQNFRGGINGTVTDHTGATLANASVVALNVDTGVSRATLSSSAGEYSFQDLPLGTYTVTVTDAGFAVAKYEKITLSAGTAYTLPVSLSISSSAQTVDVVAGALALDTTSAILTTSIPSEVVNDAPSNGRDFTQFIQYTPGFAGYSVGGGAGAAQVNGVRTNQVNWQIEGTDNNDLWWNIPAVNQGGVSGIAGIVIPLDAIEQFSFVTSGMPETGRNAGGTVNLSIKSGTNTIHGDAYYYNRNEKFAAESPFAPPGTEKSKTRDIDYGGSFGGPIIKDKLFYFLSYEHQNFVIGVAQAKTEPSAAYQAAATNVLGAWGIPVNPVSTALLANLWPQSALTGSASSGNYFNAGTENGHSFNPLVKLDWNINASNSISVKGYFGDGNQTAPTSSELSPYFEVAPIHVENYSVIYNHIFSSKLANQAFFGVSYFDQVFSDAEHTFDPVALGLNTGVTDPGLLGSPKITIGGAAAGSGLTGSASGFDPIGVTPPEGRQDITGHFDDAVAYTVGKHEIRFGGEFRKAQVYDFYQTGARGVFTFDGSQGPWSTSGGSAACNSLATKNGSAYDAGVTDGNVFLLADFLAGCIGTGSATIAEGNQKRTVYENTWDIFAQDAWQITPKLNLNYGVRYDYAQSVHDSDKDLTSFDPTQPGGFAIQGGNVSDLYHPYKGSISPRVGLSYSLDDKTTLHVGGGMFFDSIYMLSLLNLRGTTDGGALGIGNNLAGANPVVTAQATPTNEGGGAVITAGQPIFPSLASAQAGAGVTNAYSINPNYRPSYTYSYNLNVQHQLSSKVIMQIGYLGTLSRKLTEVLDINPEATSNLAPGVPPEDQQTRPYYNQFPNIGNVNQLNSNLNANYNSLQTSLRSTGWHGLTSQIVYTWSHALDYETGLIPYLPQDSRNVRAEYGNSDYDTRNTFSALATYALPSLSTHKLLTGGWELNTALSFHGGQPFSVVTGNDESGNGDYAERANVTGVSAFKGVSHSITHPLNASGQPGPGQVNWFNPAAFSEPTPGTFGNERRNQYFSPGFADVDFSVVKTTKIAEHVSLQLRAEMFNLTNRVNLSPLGFPQTTGPTITSTIGAAFGAPGIGPGEPFNAQFVGKIIF